MSSIVPEMLQCTTCRRWWSSAPILVHASPFHTAIVPNNEFGVRTVANEDPHTAMCPCGGELAFVDMAAHRATLPVSANLPDDIARLERQKAAAAEAAAKKKAAEEAAKPSTPPTAP